jgi:hypothetical protein
MIKRFLSVITILSFGLVLSTAVFAQSGRPKVSRTAKKYNKVRGFSSTTQPHADGLVLERRSSGRKRVTKPVRRLEAENGGLDTADESPEFGTGERTKAPTGQIVIEDHVDMISAGELKPSGQRSRTAKRKNSGKTQNLLPYLEQSNLRKKRIRHSGTKTIKRKSNR